MNYLSQFKYIMQAAIKDQGITFTDTCDTAFNEFISGYSTEEMKAIVDDYTNTL